tara:strand:- start:933 stop:1241 length:309 start_codon:yes stop_codon:yes gene_type:complete
MADPAELHARLVSRAIADLSADQRDLRAVVVASRLAEESTARELSALRSEMAAQTRSGFIAWADRNPWPAALLIIAILLGLSGQLSLLSQIVPLGAVHATGT